MTSLNSPGFPGSHLESGGQKLNLETELLGKRTPPGAQGAPAGRRDPAGPGPAQPGRFWAGPREGACSKQGSDGVGDAFQAGSSAQAKAWRLDGTSRGA